MGTLTIGNLTRDEEVSALSMREVAGGKNEEVAHALVTMARTAQILGDDVTAGYLLGMAKGSVVSN